jgi:hypothetical protein
MQQRLQQVRADVSVMQKMQYTPSLRLWFCVL